jgi:hypothetical protein
MIIIKHQLQPPPSQTDIDAITETVYLRLLNLASACLPIRLRFRDSVMSVIIDIGNLANTLVLAVLMYMVNREARRSARRRGGRA